MYVSKYYTCEEIDQRLLQGYYDDFVRAGFAGTINEFWAFVLSIKDKVDKKEGYGLSKNDFTDELKAKLDGIEEKANYITKVSELEMISSSKLKRMLRRQSVTWLMVLMMLLILLRNWQKPWAMTPTLQQLSQINLPSFVLLLARK